MINLSAIKGYDKKNQNLKSWKFISVNIDQ
jgi:hypothetical protein